MQKTLPEEPLLLHDAPWDQSTARVVFPLSLNGPVLMTNFTLAAARIRSPSPTWAQPPPPQP